MIERAVVKMPTCEPAALWARGEYERIRGDYEAALSALDRALARLPAGRHMFWPMVAGTRLQALCERSCFSEARSDGERALEVARQADLGYVTSYVRMPLAYACAKLGDAEAAWVHADAALASFEAPGTRGLNLGLAYEASARVAACLGDTPRFEHYGQLCRDVLLAFPNPALAAKYHRLMSMLRSSAAGGGSEAEMVSPGRSQIARMLSDCADREERLARALELLIAASGASSGYLFSLYDSALVLCARGDELPVPAEVEAHARSFLAHELASYDDMHTATAIDDGRTDGSSAPAAGDWRRPILLDHYGPEGHVLCGVALLTFAPHQAPRTIGETASLLSRFAVEHGDLRPLTYQGRPGGKS